MLERQWQEICLDIEELDELIAKNAEKYRKKIDETKYL
jgi:hypothetical protein